MRRCGAALEGSARAASTTSRRPPRDLHERAGRRRATPGSAAGWEGDAALRPSPRGARGGVSENADRIHPGNSDHRPAPTDIRVGRSPRPLAARWPRRDDPPRATRGNESERDAPHTSQPACDAGPGPRPCGALTTVAAPGSPRAPGRAPRRAPPPPPPPPAGSELGPCVTPSCARAGPRGRRGRGRASRGSRRCRRSSSSSSRSRRRPRRRRRRRSRRRRRRRRRRWRGR